MAPATANNAHDPANILSKTVKIHSITSKPELNGRMGTVTSFLVEQNRYIVQFAPLPPAIRGSAPVAPASISLRPDNLTPANYLERTQHTLAEMKIAATTVFHDPRARAAVREAYNETQRRLPPRVKPEYALALIFVLLFVIVRTFGFSRTVFFASLVGLVGSVVLPDVMAGAGVRGVARNFPSRWRAMVVEGTGFGWITERMALGAFLVLILMSGNLLRGSSKGGGGGGAGQSRPQSSSSNDLGYNTQSGEGSLLSWTMEDVYKMGFDDATQEKDHGTSLPVDHASLGYFASNTQRTMAASSSSTDGDFDLNDYKSSTSPNPPPPKKSGFGLGTVLSLFAIGRAVKDMGFTHDGQFDFALFVANARLMEKWKLGFLGIALYRVVSSFL